MKDLVVALALTLLVQAVLSMTAVAPAVLAPVAQTDVGVAASSIGIFTALVYFAAALSAPLGGALVARSGAIRVSQYCLLFSGGGFALCTLAYPAVLVAGALLVGTGYGAITPASSAILVARTPDRVRNVVMSIRQTGVPLGGALAGILVPLMLLVFDWKATVLLLAGLCILCMFALQTVRGRYDAVRHHAPSAPRPTFMTLMRMVYAHPELRQSALASFAYGGMQWCLASYLVVFLTERANVSLINAGIALFVAMVGGVIGRVLWGIVADVVANPRRVLGALGVLMTVAAFATSQVTAGWPLSAIIVLSAVYGGTAIGWNGVYVAEIARAVPADQVATATGASLTFTYFGVVVMPFVFWVIVTVSASYAVAFAAAGLPTLIAGLSYFRRTA